MARKLFLRQGYWRYSKLGLRRKNKLIYRKAKGGDNKVRLQEKGRIVKVKVGFKKNKNVQGFVQGLKPVLVYSIEDLKKLKKNEIAVLAKIGSKKKIEIANYAIKNNVKIINLNAGKFMKEILFEKKKKLQIKTEKEKKHKEIEAAVKKKEEEDKAETEGKDKEKHDHEHEHTPEHVHEKKEETVKEDNMKKSTEEKQ